MKDGAVIYCRVSSEEQVENNSLAIQRKEAHVHLDFRMRQTPYGSPKTGTNDDFS